MGLDIYFYKITDSKIYKKYLDKRNEMREFNSSLDIKYQKQIKAFENKYQKWYSKNSSRQNVDWDKAPKPDFYTSDELFKRDNLQKEIIELRKCANINYDSQLSQLYMRKQNWMVKFVETRHPELLIDSSYGKILKNGEAILNKNDIKNLIKRMTTIKNFLPNNWKTRMSNEYATAINELKDLCDKNLPTLGRFFFGSTEYDRDYFTAIVEVYLPRFKELLEEWVPGQKILYCESW